MRARRTHQPAGVEYDGFDLPPPEVYDAPPEAFDAPPEAVIAADPSMVAPVHVCLVCGDDPQNDSGCPHYEVATVERISPTMLHTLAELRAQYDTLRDQLRTLRRLAGAGVTAGDVTVEVREAPVVAPRVVLIPPPAPPAKRPKRPAPAVQGAFGFAQVAEPAEVEPSVAPTEMATEPVAVAEENGGSGEASAPTPRARAKRGASADAEVSPRRPG